MSEYPFDDKFRDRINIGDRVCVNFNNAKFTWSTNAEVLNIPCATGDSWQFKDIASGQIAYISEGCTVTKIREELK